MVESLRDILAKGVTCASGRDSPTSPETGKYYQIMPSQRLSPSQNLPRLRNARNTYRLGLTKAGHTLAPHEALLVVGPGPWKYE